MVDIKCFIGHKEAATCRSSASLRHVVRRAGTRELQSGRRDRAPGCTGRRPGRRTGGGGIKREKRVGWEGEGRKGEGGGRWGVVMDMRERGWGRLVSCECHNIL